MSKKIALVIIALVLICNTNVKSQIKVDAAGSVTLGNIKVAKNGAYGGFAINSAASIGNVSCVFDVNATHFNTTSDKRQKENIKGLSQALGLILKLEGVKFDYKKESVILKSLNKNGSNNEQIEKARLNKVGFLAQDVEKVIPEVVSYNEETDLYSMDYTKVVPYLVEAIKEQQLIIDAQSLKIKEIENLSNSNSNNKKSGQLNSDVLEQSIVTNAFLYQNMPNPFTYETKIQYYIPEEAKNAMLYIFNLNGNMLKSEEINATGNGSITVSGSELEAGMYVYSLLIDGQEVDTKRMILTE